MLAAMSPKPEPKDPQSVERKEWITMADRETRAAHPSYYWGCREFDKAPRLYWNEIEVSEKEFRAYAGREQLLNLRML
jgi:hypothetical protein